jgi:hypothetical protein
MFKHEFHGLSRNGNDRLDAGLEFVSIREISVSINQHQHRRWEIQRKDAKEPGRKE